MLKMWVVMQSGLVRIYGRFGVYFLHVQACNAEVPKLWGEPPGGALLDLWGWRVISMRNIFILNETWAQGNIHISVGTLISRNIGTGSEL
jgi:hypothetical protein